MGEPVGRVVVEDEQPIRDAILAERFAATAFADLPDPTDLLATAPDLLVRDVLLPSGNGFDLAMRLRRQRELPIIFLTARDAVADLVFGLELGADDYLIKPFALRGRQWCGLTTSIVGDGMFAAEGYPDLGNPILQAVAACRNAGEDGLVPGSATTSPVAPVTSTPPLMTRVRQETASARAQPRAAGTCAARSGRPPGRVFGPMGRRSGPRPCRCRQARGRRGPSGHRCTR
jgi:CheY-like chemotaxis protein